MRGEMPQKLACRMGMGESGHQKPQISERPRWSVDALSDCTSANSYRVVEHYLLLGAVALCTQCRSAPNRKIRSTKGSPCHRLKNQ
jgi:hypothetical protein